MAHMNERSFDILFQYGKKLYLDEISINDASMRAHEEAPEVAISSAKHYINWYPKMRNGEILTWNTNIHLLLYYAERIIQEEGKKAGAIALFSASQYASHAHRDDLAASLQQLSEKYEIMMLPEHVKSGDNEDSFRVWLEKQKSGIRENTINRYIRALKMASTWLNINLSMPVMSTNTIEEYTMILDEIESTPDYMQINQEHGHGDLSAALKKYNNFLIAKSEQNALERKQGKFDSWEIIDDKTAIKYCDKSFFEHNGSGVPKEIAWFFHAAEMEKGSTHSVSFIWKDKAFTGRIQKESSETQRIRIFWNTELGKEFSQYSTIQDISLRYVKQDDDHYILSFQGDEPEVKLTVKEIIAKANAYIASRGFSYEGKLIENFYLSLKSKPFVILAGTSGTGKTRLVKLFAEALGAKYKLVPVRPDWSDSSDLFGHVDLNGKFVPGAVLDFIKAAKDDPDRPYFLCLDEMNLARVEYYLSDFLSVIETRDMVNGKMVSDPLIDEEQYGSDEDAFKKYGRIIFPQNLYVVGTVNMDETTFPFSKKVLDRANTIEFNYVDLIPNAVTSDASESMSVKNSFLRSDYLLLSQCIGEDEYIGEICAELQKINAILQKANAHVGYRVRDEIVFYMLNNKKAGDLLPHNEALDHEILQKILPRIQGSSASVKDMLCQLFDEFAVDHNQCSGENDSEKMQKALDDAGVHCKYRKSAEKLLMMVRRFEEDGFTSYWL